MTNERSDLVQQLAEAMKKDPKAWCRDPLLGDLALAYAGRNADPQTWAAIREVLAQYHVVRAVIGVCNERYPEEVTERQSPKKPRKEREPVVDPGWPVRRVGHDPPIYEIDVTDGITLRLKVSELVSLQTFKVKYIEATGTLPPRMTRDEHAELVEMLLARAEVVALPAEAGRHGGLLDLLGHFLSEPTVNEGIDELRAGRVIEEGGYRIVRLATVKEMVREHGWTPDETTLAQAMRELGWEPHTEGPEDKRTRAWRKKV